MLSPGSSVDSSAVKKEMSVSMVAGGGWGQGGVLKLQSKRQKVELSKDGNSRKSKDMSNTF